MVEGSLFWRLTTPLEVEELCGYLDLHKGIGWDRISLMVIKMVAHEIPGPLSNLLNCCIRAVTTWLCLRWQGLYPSLRARTPQISLITSRSLYSVLFQVFEMVLQGRLVEFLGLQRVITPGQHRFRSGHSMVMTIQDMVQRVPACGMVEKPLFGSLETSRRHCIWWITGSFWQSWSIIK
jgi:hypothetical protein